MSPAGANRRKTLSQALLSNLKENNVLLYFLSQNPLIIPFSENSIILEVHLCLCLKPVSAYIIQRLLYDGLPLTALYKNVTHYKYRPAACNESTASAGAALTASAGM